jgi:lysophospholipase L1-like esterase
MARQGVYSPALAQREGRMRCRLIVVTTMLLVCGGVAQAAPPPPYYLALGDSLALGIQPDASGALVPTNQGYVDDLYALYRVRYPNLRLQKLGCSGETTTSMLTGGVCDYPSGTQLAQAVRFIQTHRVALITLSIGGDNVLQCFSLGGIDPTCVGQGLATIGPDVGQILAALRAAAGPAVRIVGMNYFDPFLAAWTLGPAGQALAYASLDITNDLNLLLGTLYFAFQVPVADVAAAYRIADFTPVPGFNLPRNVLLEFAWTWIGASPPVGPDIHPNATGYAAIAWAFVKAIGN